MARATVEYGRAAIASLVVILGELVLIATASMGRHRSWAAVALIAALVAALSLWWAVTCQTRQRRRRAPLRA